MKVENQLPDADTAAGTTLAGLPLHDADHVWVYGRSAADHAPVELDEVTRRHGSLRALDGVTLAVERGEFTLLTGPHGSGKTTLMKLVVGLIAADRGSVKLFGRDAAGPAAVSVRRHVGYLPEAIAFPPTLTGEEILAFHARLKGLPAGAGSGLLSRLGLGYTARRRVGTWSTDACRRLALAQALLGRPRLLLLDEPAAGLEAASVALLHELLDEARRAGTTILCCAYASGGLEQAADRIIELRRGRIFSDLRPCPQREDD